MRIEACFDSHVHWLATGEFAQRLPLEDLASAAAVQGRSSKEHHWRGEWLLGYGWDDSGWSESPNRTHIDKWIADRPVALTRADGHAIWVNTEALRRVGLWPESNTEILPDPIGGRIERDADGWPTGLLVDQAAEVVRHAIPALSAPAIRGCLLQAARVFNQAGFTHIRDMTCDERQWAEAVHVDQAGLLTVAAEIYFWVHSFDHLDSGLTLAVRSKSQETPNLRVKGIKIFLDGALGSEGAWISGCYAGHGSSGLTLWTDDQLAFAMSRSWGLGLEIAVHAIGDRACEQAVATALKLQARGMTGSLHIEHAELMRPDTIERMLPLNVRVHMQPSHWLADGHWLHAKVGDLAACAFPWRRLQECGVSFDFGSDSPMVRCDIGDLLRGLDESASSGVPRLLGSPHSRVCHPDLAWAPNSYTSFVNGKPNQVVFRGRHLL